jgi:hypothetical protein
MTPNERNGSGVGGGAERDPRLDRAYRAGAREDPPAHLDAAILAAARREVGARPHAISARLRAWRVPVSIAAVVVLSVSVVTLVREEGGGKLEQPGAADLYSKPAETAPAAPAAAPGTAKAPEAAEARAKLPATAPAAKDDAALGATASARIAGEAARREDQARAGQSAAPELPAARSAPAPSPQPFQGAPAAPERRPALAADRAAGAGTATQSTGTRASEAEASVTPTEPASAPRSAARMMQRDRAATEDASGSLSAVRPPAPVAAAEKPSPRAETRTLQTGPATADTARVAALLKEFDPQVPEKWLEKIEALKREGRKGEADELLAEFKRRFPNHPLPPGLR